MAVDLTAICVAQYKLNDNAASMVVLDAMGGGNGTTDLFDTADMHAAGKIDGALQFDGVNNYVETGRTFESVFQGSGVGVGGGFAVSFWFKGTGEAWVLRVSPFGVFADGGTYPNTPQVEVQIGAAGGDNIIFEGKTAAAEAGGWRVIGDEVLLDTWYHVVAQCTQLADGLLRAEIFLDTVAQGVGGGATLTETLSEYTCDLTPTIGASKWFQEDEFVSNFFTGLVDNLCIFNRPLTTDEIAFLYNEGNGTEELKEEDMAITVNNPTEATAADMGNQRLMFNATGTADTADDFVPAVAGKSIILIDLIISSAATQSITIRDGDTTAVLGPYSMIAGVPLVVPLNRNDNNPTDLSACPKLTAGNAAYVYSSSTGVVTLTGHALYV